MSYIRNMGIIMKIMKILNCWKLEAFTALFHLKTWRVAFSQFGYSSPQLGIIWNSTLYSCSGYQTIMPHTQNLADQNNIWTECLKLVNFLYFLNIDVQVSVHYPCENFGSLKQETWIWQKIPQSSSLFVSLVQKWWSLGDSCLMTQS